MTAVIPTITARCSNVPNEKDHPKGWGNCSQNPLRMRWPVLPKPKLITNRSSVISSSDIGGEVSFPQSFGGCSSLHRNQADIMTINKGKRRGAKQARRPTIFATAKNCQRHLVSIIKFMIFLHVFLALFSVRVFLLFCFLYIFPRCESYSPVIFACL